MFYSYFAALGYEIAGVDGRGVEQPRPAGHGGAHRRARLPVHLIGVEFSRKTRNVTAFVGADG